MFFQQHHKTSPNHFSCCEDISRPRICSFSNSFAALPRLKFRPQTVAEKRHTFICNVQQCNFPQKDVSVSARNPASHSQRQIFSIYVLLCRFHRNHCCADQYVCKKEVKKYLDKQGAASEEMILVKPKSKTVLTSQVTNHAVHNF